MALDMVLIGGGIGVLVGLSGMGGASLLVPALAWLGWPLPAVVRTALVFNAGTKGAALAFYARRGDVDWRWVGRFAAAGVPATVLGSWLSSSFAQVGMPPATWREALAVTLSLAGLSTAIKALGVEQMARLRVVGNQWPRWARTAAALTFGTMLGLSVGLTAVGAGALVAPVLQWRSRLSFRAVVGTDLAVGFLLAVVAALWHGVHPTMTGPTASLLLGSVPGAWLGRRTGAAIPRRPLSLVVSGLVVLSGMLLL